MAHDLGLAIEPGQRLILSETDYMFGQGPIALDVISLGDVAEYWGILWVVVRGVQRLVGGTQPRTVSVRLEALRAVGSRS